MVVAEVVSRAVKSANPQTRYAVGKFAKMLIRMRGWLVDRLFGRIKLNAVIQTADVLYRVYQNGEIQDRRVEVQSRGLRSRHHRRY